MSAQKKEKANMKVSLIPFYPHLGDSKANLKKIVEKIKSVQTAEKPDIIVFPELINSGYLIESLSYSSAAKIPEELPEELLALSKGCEIILGLLINENGNIYNSALVLSDNKIIHIHKKIYLPSYGLFDESRYISPGENLFSYDGAMGKSAVLVCEDAFHIALPYALYVQGVKNVFVISSSPARGVEVNYENENHTASFLTWRKRLEVYANSFGQFYFYVNRSGSEDGVFFNGESLFVSPNKLIIESKPGNDLCIEVFHDDLVAALHAGGPWQNENYTLNKAIIMDSHEKRPK